MKILFLSDFLPVDTLKLDDSFTSLIEEVDKVVFNLEGSPTYVSNTDCGNQILPFRISELLKFLEKFGKKKFIIALANNHILDNGEKGLDHLIETFQNNNITYLGTYNKPYITIQEKLSILNFVTAETVASYSSRKKLNYLFYNTSKINNQIKELETKETDLILYPHWGRDMDRTAFKTYDLDYDLSKWTVFGHHPHVIGKIKSGFIYSMGNTFIPHPNYYKRFKSIKYGLAALYDTEVQGYKLKITEVTSEDDFEKDFKLRITDFNSLPPEVLTYDKGFSTLKKKVLGILSFKGTPFDYFKLHTSQYISSIFKIRDWIFGSNQTK